MNSRLITLFVLVIMACSGAYYLVEQDASTQAVTEHVLFGELAAQATHLKTLEVTNSQGVVFAARQTSDGWMATHLDSLMTFPANKETLVELVSALSQARVIESKTANPDYYHRLGVEPLDAENAQSTLLTLTTKDKQWRVLIGNRSSNGLGHFVREPKQKASYLINQVIPLPVNQTEWLEQPLVSIEASDYDKVEIDGDTRLTFIKDDTEQWQLRGLAAKEQLSYPAVINQAVTDLLDVTFDDISPFIPSQWSSSMIAGKASFYRNNEPSLIFTLYQKPGEQQEYWLQLSGPDTDLWAENWMLGVNQFQVRTLFLTFDELVTDKTD